MQAFSTALLTSIQGCGDKTRTQKQVCEIFNTKYPDRRISQSTVGRIENKFHEFGNVTDIPKSGRKRILDDEQKLDILQMDWQRKRCSHFMATTFTRFHPCDFFIWGDLKQKVYSVSIENEEQLWNRIQNAVQELQNEETLRRVDFNFLCRIDFCINENGVAFNVLLLAISTPLHTTFPLLKAILEVRFCQLVRNLDEGKLPHFQLVPFNAIYLGKKTGGRGVMPRCEKKREVYKWVLPLASAVDEVKAK
ncbi:hypothetical protein NQ318_000754 [Aromia moschata]|uniref:DUF4817 domain-containing protein n=1 Tax=Aromia moschata TaxID=1265417 RepID=A0AAV8YV30_9CUCU|nr:hypothetical protein NQ318_000754 [Aromia moschata]